MTAAAPRTFRVGISDALPKLTTYRLLEPALIMQPAFRLHVRIDKTEKLLDFPRSLHGAPTLLQTLGEHGLGLFAARKAFAPGPVTFPLLHIDTTWNFREMIEFRDRFCTEHGFRLVVHVNEKALAAGMNPFDDPSNVYTPTMNTHALVEALTLHRFDAAIGGGRRDEEKSRAKERVFSVRAPGHAWEPRAQRPELWALFNTRLAAGQTMRVFPLSNWTEYDVWSYIAAESIPIVPLYLAAERPVVERKGQWIMGDDDRFRTMGDYPPTAAHESTAVTVPEIVEEMLLTTTSERSGRLIDKDEAGSMEKKKREGYF